jgi:hypothetical protein
MLTAEYARFTVENAVATITCPRCGAAITTAARACRSCGFAVLEAEGRSLPRPPSRALAFAAAGLAAVAGAVFIGAREPGPPPVPDPVPRREAESRLEMRLSSYQDDDTAAVSCESALFYGKAIRCEVRYALGGIQPIVVRLRRDGFVDWDIPALR